MFVACDQTESIVVDQLMRELSLNPKLQTICTSVGLLEHDTMYSLRRFAIVETGRSEGTELVRDPAGHKPNSASRISYDDVGLTDVDISALSTENKPNDRKETRSAFEQNKISRAADVNDKPNLQQTLNASAAEAMHADEVFVEMEREFVKITDNIAVLLETPPLPLTQGVFGRYRGMLRDADEGYETTIEGLDAVLSKRKQLRKKLMSKHTRLRKRKCSSNIAKT